MYKGLVPRIFELVLLERKRHQVQFLDNQQQSEKDSKASSQESEREIYIHEDRISSILKKPGEAC